MANEIGLFHKMTMVQGNFSYAWEPGLGHDGALYTSLVGSPNCDTGLFTATTAGADLSLTNVTTPGYVALRNTDTTNYVDVGYDDSGTFRPFIRLNPNELAMFRVQPTATIEMKAHTANCVVQYMVFQN